MIRKIFRSVIKKREKVCLSRGEHKLKITGGTLDYYVHFDIKTGAVVPVFFHAAIDRKKIELPRFEGINMCKKNGWPAISFADPILEMYDGCSLAWFVGNDRYCKLQKEIHKFLDRLCKKYKLTFVFHGGSGGGYAALVQKSYFKGGHMAIVQNPQTNIWDLSKQHTINYFMTFECKPEEEKFGELVKKYHLQDRVLSEQLDHVIYLQNQTDYLHVNKHWKPFLGKDFEAEGKYISQKAKENYYYVGNWGEGHAVLPIEILEEILTLAINGSSIGQIRDFIANNERLNLTDYR